MGNVLLAGHMPRTSKTGIAALLIGSAICIFFLAVFSIRSERHLRTIAVESVAGGLECAVSHRWFGEVHGTEIGWRGFVPGWKIEFLGLLRAYRPVSISALSSAVNYLSGPIDAAFVDQPDGVLDAFLEGLETQNDVTGVTIIRCEGDADTWKKLDRFPALETLELTAANYTGATLPAFPNLLSYWSDWACISDTGLESLARSPKLAEVSIDQKGGKHACGGATISEEGLKHFFASCRYLKSFSAGLDFSQPTIDRLKYELDVLYPSVDIGIGSTWVPADYD